MLIIYGPAAIYSTWALHSVGGISSLGPAPTQRPAVVAALLSVHFLKRVFETLFLHKYSGSGDLGTSLFIAVNYTAQSLLINSQQHMVPESSRMDWCFKAGTALFAIGQLGNLYHHYLLATLRPASTKQDGAKTYSVPRGGFFEFVTMPHYFFELVAWLGIAVAAQQANAWLGLASMASYLAGRSVATRNWYLEKVEGYPAERKNLVPFIF
jgi:very-long-chain enoyl-CoA reductase